MCIAKEELLNILTKCKKAKCLLITIFVISFFRPHKGSKRRTKMPTRGHKEKKGKQKIINKRYIKRQAFEIIN